MATPTDTATLTEARMLLGRGEQRAAKALLEGLVVADAANAEAWYLLAAVNHRLGSLDAAVAAYERVISLDARHVAAHYFLGNLHGERGEHERAAACYRRALDSAPLHASAARHP